MKTLSTKQIADADEMFSLNELAILPSSMPIDIKSRSECDPYINGKLPIMVSPMTCILGADNFHKFTCSRVTPIYPRENKSIEERIRLAGEGQWIAVSEAEFVKAFVEDSTLPNGVWNVLIDTANGHRKSIYDEVRTAKLKYGDKLQVMVGNIANPGMYLACCQSGVDYVRVSIGTGSGCTTGTQTGIHASMPWLLASINDLSHEIDANNTPVMCKTKVIADGGLDTIDKAIKCFALGADYVMMGKTFAMTEEARGEEREENGKRMRLYYGQASEYGQRDMYNKVVHNPEGCATTVPIKFSLDQYSDLFEAAIRSSMSYIGARSLKEFREMATFKRMSKTEYDAFHNPYK